jgi:hypothetical protein
MAQFILKITLGNEVMQTGYDIAMVLKALSKRIDSVDDIKGEYGKLMDLNGNTVGSWQVK